jgi:hypothetical protein
VVSIILDKEGGSGLRAPARSLVALVIGVLAYVGPVYAQGRSQPQPQVAASAPTVGVPDSLTVAKLVWSTMAAVDHANATGNYSVLRDLGAPSFQANNNAATLAGIFQNIRIQRLDLSNTLLVTPTFDIGPQIEGGMLRMRGAFPLRPTGVAFDLLFQPLAGRWALFGIAIAPVANVAPVQPPRR